jgi:hypothetical protein
MIGPWEMTNDVSPVKPTATVPGRLEESKEPEKQMLFEYQNRKQRLTAKAKARRKAT